MLRSIRAENFLSLKNTEVELGQLNIFVGRNASGKSNLVKLLRFVSLLATHGGISKAAEGIGFRNVRDLAYGRASENRITITLDAILDKDYVYNISFRALGRIEMEELQVEGITVLKRGDSETRYLKEDGSWSWLDPGPTGIALHIAGNIADASPQVKRFADFLRGWAFYNFNPAAIRGSSPIGASERLYYNGGNLPQVLHTLLTTRRKEFNKVEELLRSAAPEVEELLTPIKDNRVRIAIREQGFEEHFEPENLSDGTLRLLAFITALALPNPLVSFEEPENCVHPELLGALVELIRLSGKQVIVTTHSPKLLDHAKPGEVYLVAKVRGETRIRKLTAIEDMDAVKKFLELGGSLGEAWLSGLLENGY